MENENYKKEPVLLPVYFKKIGLAVMVLAFVATISVRTMNVQWGIGQKEMFREFTLNGFILGLLLLACSRDKVEDEMTVLIRLKSMSWTFIWAVLYVIISPIFDLLFDDVISNLTGKQVVGSMLFVYLIMYNWQKKIR
jgi:hypothetical protein